MSSKVHSRETSSARYFSLAHLLISATRFVHPGPFWRPSDAERDSLLLDAAVALRAGEPAHAARILDPYLSIFTGDAAYLNLQGAIAEAKGNHSVAKRLYSVAASVDPRFPAARRNIERLTLAHCPSSIKHCVSLGDQQIRSHRNLSRAKVAV